MTDQKEPQYLGSPTELADAEEVPGWFAGIVTALSAFPLLISIFCGGLFFIIPIILCIIQLLL